MFEPYRKVQYVACALVAFCSVVSLGNSLLFGVAVLSVDDHNALMYETIDDSVDVDCRDAPFFSASPLIVDRPGEPIAKS
jgi:hypothetical protein